ncbi:hypothetical protein F9802_15850 [Bacillus aerolatus]|uniref:Uncharacterized protein n=1 Tax=Bacillus aerolatus TaxID=2653354 RepID=A0A6I1FCV5_9BACI|nr:hypothetical protein [Bacillus aerolatus]KAB7705031.1 hypothetical protein F9802_15850 [Bacillus aerolatus]
MNESYWLKNARLECGFMRENGRVTGTITDLYHLLIEAGKVTKIVKAGSAVSISLPVKDAQGFLLLSSFI